MSHPRGRGPDPSPGPVKCTSIGPPSPCCPQPWAPSLPAEVRSQVGAPPAGTRCCGRRDPGERVRGPRPQLPGRSHSHSPHRTHSPVISGIPVDGGPPRFDSQRKTPRNFTLQPEKVNQPSALLLASLRSPEKPPLPAADPSASLPRGPASSGGAGSGPGGSPFPAGAVPGLLVRPPRLSGVRRQRPRISVSLCPIILHFMPELLLPLPPSRCHPCWESAVTARSPVQHSHRRCPVTGCEALFSAANSPHSSPVPSPYFYYAALVFLIQF